MLHVICYCIKLNYCKSDYVGVGVKLAKIDIVISDNLKSLRGGGGGGGVQP